MPKDKFKMNDGRIVTVDFSSMKSVLSVSKEDWEEIKSSIEHRWYIAKGAVTGKSQLIKNFKEINQ